MRRAWAAWFHEFLFQQKPTLINIPDISHKNAHNLCESMTKAIGTKDRAARLITTQIMGYYYCLQQKSILNIPDPFHIKCIPSNETCPMLTAEPTVLVATTLYWPSLAGLILAVATFGAGCSNRTESDWVSAVLPRYQLNDASGSASTETASKSSWSAGTVMAGGSSWTNRGANATGTALGGLSGGAGSGDRPRKVRIVSMTTSETSTFVSSGGGAGAEINLVGLTFASQLWSPMSGQKQNWSKNDL